MLNLIEKVALKGEYDIRLVREKRGYRLYFKTQENRIGILYRISAALYVEEWNIIEMRATTGKNGEVEDCFLIEPLENRLSYILEYTLLSSIDKVLKNGFTVMNYVAKFPKKWKNLLNENRKKSGNVEVKTVDGGFELSIETQDRPGLIFEITQVLYRLYFDIITMKSETQGDKALDKIYVVRDAQKQGKYDGQILEEALHKIIE